MSDPEVKMTIKTLARQGVPKRQIARHLKLNEATVRYHLNRKWVQDITYLATDEGWFYLAVVIDLYSRQVIGWAMDRRMKARLVCDALKMALWRRAMPSGVIVHSDRGSQYCSQAFQALLKRHGLRCSMSKRVDCYDNACAESFFHSLKIELTHGKRYSTRDEL